MCSAILQNGLAPGMAQAAGGNLGYAQERGLFYPLNLNSRHAGKQQGLAHNKAQYPNTALLARLKEEPFTL